MEFKYASQPQQQPTDAQVGDGTGHYSSPDENGVVSGLTPSLGVPDDDPLRSAIANQQQPAANETTDLHPQAVDYASPVKPATYYAASATTGQYYASPVKMTTDGYGTFFGRHFVAFRFFLGERGTKRIHSCFVCNRRIAILERESV